MPSPLPLIDRPATQALMVALATAVVAGPFLFGLGVDVPDDAIYTTVSTWEGVRGAVTEGRNPFFVEGRLGGVSLHSEAIQMGPLYPAMWLAFVLPVSMALPLAFLLHVIATLLAVRWFARGYGVGPGLATLAGVAVAAGPVGLAGMIELQTDTWPPLLWFPIVLGCLHRTTSPHSETRAQSLKWMLLAGLALAMMLLGGHVRHAAGTCGAIGLWQLIRFRGFHWATGAVLIGLAAGSPGWLTAVLEVEQVKALDDSIAEWSVPPYQYLDWDFIPAWLVPRPFVTSREFSVGVLLAVCSLISLPMLRGELRRLALAIPVLLLASANPPGLRWLLFPFIWLSYPTLLLYYALAMYFAAVAGAAGLQELLRSPSRPKLKLALPGLLAVAALVGCVVVRIVAGQESFGTDAERGPYIVGAIQAAVVLAAGAGCYFGLASRPSLRSSVVVGLALADLLALGVRYHIAVPSRALDIGARSSVEGEELLSEGYLHIDEMSLLLEEGLAMTQSLQGTELSELEMSDFVGEGSFVIEEPIVDLGKEAPELQDFLLDRRWPVHLGIGRGWTSLSARAKLPPTRQTLALLPLATALSPEWSRSGHEPPEDARRTSEGSPGLHPGYPASDPSQLAALFGPGGLGDATLSLHGIPVAVDERGGVYRTSQLAPRCYSAREWQLEADATARMEQLLSGPFDVETAVLVEQAGLPESLAVAEVSCTDPYRIEVETDGDSLVVWRQRHHPGWRARLEGSGQDLDTLPVNQVHSGVLLPAGSHRVTWRFRPPGLLTGLTVAAPIWLSSLLGIFVLVRRQSDASGLPDQAGGDSE